MLSSIGLAMVLFFNVVAPVYSPPVEVIVDRTVPVTLCLPGSAPMIMMISNDVVPFDIVCESPEWTLVNTQVPNEVVLRVTWINIEGQTRELLWSKLATSFLLIRADTGLEQFTAHHNESNILIATQTTSDAPTRMAVLPVVPRTLGLIEATDASGQAHRLRSQMIDSWEELVWNLFPEEKPENIINQIHPSLAKRHSAVPFNGYGVARSLENNTNFRAGPGTDYAVIGKTLGNHTYTVLEVAQGWLRVQVPDAGDAWISAKKVEFSPAQYPVDPADVLGPPTAESMTARASAETTLAFRENATASRCKFGGEPKTKMNAGTALTSETNSAASHYKFREDLKARTGAVPSTV
ncbi:MAG: SH3 domain-containing protein [Clostridia bacterium]|nr:SH3 domain-containing protein [Clostridia bacterium]